jgi:predicted DCC family thiol-disulfide oxidoreductase YuxK
MTTIDDDPAADAEGPIVLYDGVCGLCDRSVQLILRNDRRGRFRFATLQSEGGRALLEHFGLQPEALDSVVLVEGGRAWRRSRAALHIARRMDGP